jgi:two-component system, sensor histidine kinase and response regulator
MNQEKPLVLIVDDQLVNLRVAALVLKNDYRILVAENGERAIKAAREKQPDLILLDVMMPIMSGFQVAKELANNNETKEIPIIFLTARNQTEDIIEAFKAGGVDHITKPFENLELIQRIKTHIQLSRQKKELFQTSLELKQLNEEKNKLFSVVAHDLRNFVGGSKQLMELTLKKLHEYDKAKIEDHIKEVVDNLEKTTVLMNELLSWSRKQSHRLDFSPDYFSLHTEVDKNLSNFETMANEKRISMHNQVEEGFQVYGDKNMINTILRNLIHNAIKYTYNGGAITVSSGSEDSYNHISVIDSGVGIPEDSLEAIFEESFNSTADTSGKTGSAVGLKLCREYVRKHHGMIFAENNPGGGSKFQFYIPVKPVES